MGQGRDKRGFLEKKGNCDWRGKKTNFETPSNPRGTSWHDPGTKALSLKRVAGDSETRGNASLRWGPDGMESKEKMGNSGCQPVQEIGRSVGGEG